MCLIISSFSKASKAWKSASPYLILTISDFETPMFDKWLDFIFMHTFAQNVASNMGMYLLLNAQASRLLKIEA
jgi:hypothetical protein